MAIATPSSIVIEPAEELIATAKAQIVRARHYRTGRVDRFGKVVGIDEYPEGKVPHEHQTHHLDSMGRPVFFEKFERTFTKPSFRIYRFDEGEFRVRDCIWIDRYGRIDNHHRYAYDDSTSLLIWRAEYDQNGLLFYSIDSTYDDQGQNTAEIWKDNEGQIIKTLQYTYDKAGEIAVQAELGPEGNLVGELRFTYDKEGRVTERAWHRAGSKERTSRQRYTWNKQGWLTKVELRGAKDKLSASQEFQYDDVGNVIRERWLDAQGGVYKDLRF
ncbi:MAG: hypothetical protein VKO21_08055 [Candidatus Sericytochromatia bacterium]|nr:hypothetical protein [Candidatus Sericytochromatia bacterium]